ncbi:MAG: threonine aldolase [Solirubrobacterales bacterium]|jgi:threonine aldolase|nr:threonine aldolase [Solirubrobacterales bacterium]
MHDFASDNHAGAHPEVLEAIAAANEGHAGSYGDDPWTRRAEEVMRDHFGPDARAFFVFNGTGANVSSVDALTREFEGVICTETAHMHVDECGAPERLAGTKLLTVATEHGKLAPADLARWESSRGDEHQVQPRLLSITQATELGTVYSADETRALADAARELGMYLHVDGARLANAAASLGASLAELTTGAGVDAVSFGGTKNGLLLGEAVVFCRPELAEEFLFTRKQLGQLASKMRFVSAQFEALLSGDLWLRSARRANEMATRLATAVEPIDGLEITHPVEANAVFATLPGPAIARLLAELPGQDPFYVWDAARDEVRWMCSWDTTEADVDAFAAVIAEAIRAS